VKRRMHRSPETEKQANPTGGSNENVVVESLFFVAALGRADANAQQPAANTVDGHRLAAQKAAGLEFPGLLSRLGILGICGQGFVVEDLWSGFVVKDLWSKDLWSDGTGTLLEVVKRPPLF
jgi:hypothetical protein